MTGGLIACVLGFLTGSLPFGYWIPLWVRKEDIRKLGSKNPGFTNVARIFGWRVAVPVLALDVGKGTVASVLGFQLGEGSLEIAILAGFFAAMGHMFSPWLGFRGGKGIATGFGALIPIYRLDLSLPLLAFLLGFSVTRYVSLGSLLATFAFALITFSWKPYNESPLIILVALVISVVVFYKHRQNIARILSGTENRL